jgi:hypothetical protein
MNYSLRIALLEGYLLIIPGLVLASLLSDFAARFATTKTLLVSKLPTIKRYAKYALIISSPILAYLYYRMTKDRNLIEIRNHGNTIKINSDKPVCIESEYGGRAILGAGPLTITKGNHSSTSTITVNDDTTLTINKNGGVITKLNTGTITINNGTVVVDGNRPIHLEASNKRVNTVTYNNGNHTIVVDSNSPTRVEKKGNDLVVSGAANVTITKHNGKKTTEERIIVCQGDPVTIHGVFNNKSGSDTITIKGEGNRIDHI